MRKGKDFLSAIRDSGLVGQGGAGFPAHVKYSTTASVVIANGCECEPLLGTDCFLMTEKSSAIIEGLHCLMRHVGAKKGLVALKAKHAQAAEALGRALRPGMELLLLENHYPIGDEHTLVRLATGATVPPLGLPIHTGALVANVGTLSGIADACAGMSVTSKLLTVAGEVRNPGVFKAPLGMPLQECLAAAGGALAADPVFIVGGPLMGMVLDSAEGLLRAVVTKTTSGIIVLPRNHPLHLGARGPLRVLRRRAAAACIQCRLCTDLCPRYLNGQPFETHRVMRAFAAGEEMTSPAGRQALLCCECGVCELYACPMGLSPRRINVAVKNSLRQQKLTYEEPVDAGEGPRTAALYRGVPAARLAERVGLGPYLGQHVPFQGVLAATHVRIPLRQHVGAPAVPVVKPGEKVLVGQCVADIPEGALGARVHASISGEVTEVGDSVCITAQAGGTL